MGGRPDNSVSCRNGQLLMSLYIQDDPDLAPDQRDALEAHLAVCRACAEEYEQDRRLVALLRPRWLIGEDTKQLLPQGGYEVQDGYACTKRWRPMTAAEGWEDLKRRCPSLAAACRRPGSQSERGRKSWASKRMCHSRSDSAEFVAGRLWPLRPAKGLIHPLARIGSRRRIRRKYPRNLSLCLSYTPCPPGDEKK